MEQQNLKNLPDSPYYWHAAPELAMGWKKYEVTNHLGNLLSVLSDRKKPKSISSGIATSYDPVIISAMDYYPFGLEMEGRTADFENYRYGFNGKEALRNNEWGSQTHYDYGFRIYNPGLGRFLSVDPLAAEMPSWSPYAYVANNPLKYIDPDGRKIIVADKAQRSTVLGYLNDQFGSGLYKFNRRGKLKVNRRAFRTAQKSFNKEQSAMAAGLNEVIKSKRTLEAKIYADKNIDFSRNPQIPVENPTTGQIEYKPKYEGGKGVVIPELTQEGITVHIDGDNRAFILINQELSKSGTFEANGEGQTSPCESCIFIHEALDHGLDYIRTGSTDEPSGSTKANNVKFHNDALINKDSKTRTGHDHQ